MKIALLFSLLVSPLYAFTTQYVSFDQPEGWACELSQGVFICQSTTDPDRKEALVMSIATVATEWDTLENYENYLKQPRNIPNEQGGEITSKVTYVRRRNINGFVWVDSLQQNSELPGFWSRYLATVQNQLAILITYIVSEERYQTLAPQFERMVTSLKPNKDFNLNVATKQGQVTTEGAEVLGAQKNILSQRLKAKKPDPVLPPEKSTFPTTQLALFILAIVALILFVRRKK